MNCIKQGPAFLLVCALMLQALGCATPPTEATLDFTTRDSIEQSLARLLGDAPKEERNKVAVALLFLSLAYRDDSALENALQGKTLEEILDLAASPDVLGKIAAEALSEIDRQDE